MVFITVKLTVRDRVSPFVVILAVNFISVSRLLAWFLVQLMKVVLNFFVERKWDLRILCGSGGMFFFYSVLCTVLIISVVFCYGVADLLFSVCLGFSFIVMYDIIGVRRYAGMQVKVNCFIFL